MNNLDKSSSLDDLEKKLNSPNSMMGVRDRKPLHEKIYETPLAWQSTKPVIEESTFLINEKKTNWFFRFFILTFIFFLGALGYLGYRFYFNSGVDASNVDIAINAPLTVGAGEQFNFEAVIQNKNQVGMRYMDIEVEYPDGTRSMEDIGTELKNTKETVDSFPTGAIIKKNYGALLFGEETDKKEIRVLLTYQIDDITTLFKKEKKFDVVLKSSPVRLTVTNVKEITSGQQLEFSVEVVSNSTQTLKNVLVQAVYPYGFTFTNSSIAAQDDKKTWIIPTLAPKETVTFKVNGTLVGQNKDDKFFNFSTGLEKGDTNTPEIIFSTRGTTVSLTRPFLEVDLAINENNSDVIILDSEKSENAIVSFKNNTDYPLRNASISLLINGSVLNKDSVQVGDGFYQSLTNSILWDSTTAEKLISIPVGSSGFVSFNFSALGISSSYLAQNPELTFTIHVKGTRNSESKVPEIIENSIVKKIKFNSQVALNTKSEYYSSVISNTGPIPPKAEQKTTYTATVSISNTTNIVKDGVVRMKIPNYVQYNGVYLPNTENITYDSVTRTITWNVGDLSQKNGYGGVVPRKSSFQLSIIPSISQAGTAPSLVQDIQFTGTDSFTGKQIREDGLSISTQISDAKDFYDAQVSR